MHGGHYISRRYNSRYFNVINVHAQCAGCNMFRGGELHLYTEKLIEKYGYDEFTNLLQISKQSKKFTKEELIEIYNKYKKLNS